MSDKKKRAGAKQSETTAASYEFRPTKAHRAKEGPTYRYALLGDWLGLNSAISGMSEDEVMALMDYERRNKCRPTTVLRLHARMNKLRAQRERAEVVQPLPKRST